jgi:imidazolonepropionase-like amidohydrolase
MAVVIQGGKIRQVVPVAEMPRPGVRRLGNGSVLCPGLIDLCASIGAVEQTLTTVQVVDPAVSAVDAVDPEHKDFAGALRAGITAAMVNPAPTNLVSGTCVSFRTRVTDGKLDVLRDDGPLVLGLGEVVWQRERPPTSRAGALHRLRTLLAEAGAGNADPRINAVVAGRGDALMFCPSIEDIDAARDTLGELADQFVFVHSDDALDLAADSQPLPGPVVVGPYTFSSDRRVLLGAAALSEAGVDVALRGGFPHAPPEGLRISAALAVRHGLKPAKARQAMTAVPAQVAGLAGQVGSIAPGRDADLVVFSGDPLRLDATVREVYIKGVRVYAAASRERSWGEER